MDILSKEANNDPLEECFSLNVDLPFNVQIMPKKLSPHDLERINALNNTLFDIVLSQSDVPFENTDVDDALMKQLKLTEAKVDLALLWLSRLVFSNSKLPVSQKLEINTFGIRFQQTQTLTHGAYLQIELYVDGGLAEPIRLEAEVQSYENNRVTARFIDMAAQVEEKLEKYIFRTHRRAIANKRLQ